VKRSSANQSSSSPSRSFAGAHRESFFLCPGILSARENQLHRESMSTESDNNMVVDDAPASLVNIRAEDAVAVESATASAEPASKPGQVGWDTSLLAASRDESTAPVKKRDANDYSRFKNIDDTSDDDNLESKSMYSLAGLKPRVACVRMGLLKKPSAPSSCVVRQSQLPPRSPVRLVAIVTWMELSYAAPSAKKLFIAIGSVRYRRAAPYFFLQLC
jgi:hypothetical protein